MPYRVLAPLIAARLRATSEDAEGGYDGAESFIDDLETIADSLVRNKGRHAGLLHYLGAGQTRGLSRHVGIHDPAVRGPLRLLDSGGYGRCRAGVC